MNIMTSAVFTENIYIFDYGLCSDICDHISYSYIHNVAVSHL